MFISLLAFLVGCDSPRQQQESDVIEAKTTSSSLNKSFDINATNIGPEFRGEEIVSIIDVMKEHESELKAPEKDEFETSDAYAKRMASFKPLKLILGDVSPEDYYLSFLPAAGYELKYDADQQKLTVDIPEALMLSWSVYDETLLNSRSYKASNAFGGEVNVQETNKVRYQLERARYDRETMETDFGGKFEGKFSRDILMHPDQARSWKNNAKILIVCKLREPWFELSNSTSEPRFDSPTAGTTTTYSLHIKLEQIWLYDYYTGKVLKKWLEDSEEVDVAKVGTKS